ncbi:hypothetical protein GWK47_025000 [Chionoecetes opilio]|uniref:Uncharacterized protein n=1 Tax=Chionoecetes opilio TaxID=41210 RepID=A0A8J4XL47_CHIOP|nr:hypothetical protein GWK47_025000 [Chionoecetes opilio]
MLPEDVHLVPIEVLQMIKCGCTSSTPCSSGRCSFCGCSKVVFDVLQLSRGPECNNVNTRVGSSQLTMKKTESRKNNWELRNVSLDARLSRSVTSSLLQQRGGRAEPGSHLGRLRYGQPTGNQMRRLDAKERGPKTTASPGRDAKSPGSLSSSSPPLSTLLGFRQPSVTVRATQTPNPSPVSTLTGPRGEQPHSHPYSGVDATRHRGRGGSPAAGKGRCSLPYTPRLAHARRQLKALLAVLYLPPPSTPSPSRRGLGGEATAVRLLAALLWASSPLMTWAAPKPLTRGAHFLSCC